MAELFLLLVALGSQGAGRITTAHDNPHRQHDLPLQAAAQAEGAGLAEITGPAVVTTKQRATLHPTGGTPSTPAAPTPANDDGPKVGKSAIVTSRKPQTWRSDVRRRNTSGEAMQPSAFPGADGTAAVGGGPGCSNGIGAGLADGAGAVGAGDGVAVASGEAVG